MPGTPPTTPRLGLPRYSGADAADYPTQTNAIVDLLDPSSGLGGVPINSRQALTQTPVLEVGIAGQVKAGRQLALADFTALGLGAPIGLWNLSALTDASGNGRTLVNKGTVPFGVGINGLATTAAAFAGSTGQALYIADTGAADPFRIKTGSWGCWFKTARVGTYQVPMAKWTSVAGQNAWMLQVTNANLLQAVISGTGTDAATPTGLSNVVDDRWHFGVVTYDATALKLYVDGVLEAALATGTPIFGGSAPLNIGSAMADSGTAAYTPFYGRVDEAFVTADVLTEDQVRGLYCARLPHGYTVTPTRYSLSITRRKNGGPLATTDFPAQPIRLYNFTAGALTDQGSGNVTLVNNGNAINVSGADGTAGGAYHFTGANSMMATDAGLPAGTATRSYGCWFKTTNTASSVFIGWGTAAGALDTKIAIFSPGQLVSYSGSDPITVGNVADGSWHFAVVVEDNSAGDGVRRKLYLDGRLVGGSTVLNPITLGGANRFRIGSNNDGSQTFRDQIDGAFVSGVALTFEQVAVLYAKGSQALPPSPKNVGDHVEWSDSSAVYALFDDLDSTALVDLGVSA